MATPRSASRRSKRDRGAAASVFARATGDDSRWPATRSRPQPAAAGDRRSPPNSSSAKVSTVTTWTAMKPISSGPALGLHHAEGDAVDRPDDVEQHRRPGRGARHGRAASRARRGRRHRAAATARHRRAAAPAGRSARRAARRPRPSAAPTTALTAASAHQTRRRKEVGTMALRIRGLLGPRCPRPPWPPIGEDMGGIVGSARVTASMTSEVMERPRRVRYREAMHSATRHPAVRSARCCATGACAAASASSTSPARPRSRPAT